VQGGNQRIVGQVPACVRQNVSNATLALTVGGVERSPIDHSFACPLLPQAAPSNPSSDALQPPIPSRPNPARRP
jgi:hypothetical protein